MFSWSKLEVWIAVVLAGFIVVGSAGHLLADWRRGSPAVVVEARALAAADAAGEGIPAAAARSEEGAAGSDAECPEAKAEEQVTAPNRAAESAGDVDERININTAPASELQRLPGIGPALSARIVAYREAWGPFSAVEDIMEVSGIGPAKFANIQHLIKVR